MTRSSATPPDPRRQAAGRYGAFKSWANTPDRSARTRRAREAGTNGITYWLAKLDPERFADATDQQKLAAAEAAKRAHYSAMALKSAESRRRRGVPDEVLAQRAAVKAAADAAAAAAAAQSAKEHYAEAYSKSKGAGGSDAA